MGIEQNNQADRKIWQRYASGSDDALASLFKKYNNRFVAYLATRKCKDPEAICQEAWSRIIAKKNSFDGKSFSGWAFKIVRNLFAEQVRKTASRNVKQLNPDYEVAVEGEVFSLAEVDAHAQARIEAIRSCMETVGEPFLTAFRMKTLDNLKAKTIATAIGAAENTVHTRVSRAKQKIKACVETKLS